MQEPSYVLHEFVLLLDCAAETPETWRRLEQFAANACATLSSREGTIRLSFGRTARTRRRAIDAAMQEVLDANIPGVKAVSVERRQRRRGG